MKKTLIALAAVAVAGAASAQVTLSGTFNWDIGNTPAASDATMGVADAILSASASEDLGGGLSVAVNTTLQTSGGRGQLVTNNGHSIAVSGGFGSVGFKNYLAGANGLSVGVSAANDMADTMGGYQFRKRFYYTAPEMVKGLGLTIAWDSSETAGAATGTTSATGVIAATTPANPNLNSLPRAKVFVSYSGIENVGLSYSNYDGAYDISGSYDFGVAKAAVYYAKADAGDTQTEYSVSAPLGAVTVGYHHQALNNGGNTADGLTAAYALSKRTSTRFSYVNDDSGSNYRLRLSHTF